MKIEAFLPCFASVLALALSVVACKPDSNPAPKPETPVPPPTESAATAGDPEKPDSYIGLEEKAAGDMADKAGIKWRIIEVDGKPRPATMDYRPDRLNFAIKDGKVIRVTQG